MLRAISRILFWTYSRGSWQYDILCALILVFIFLTPKSVFDGSVFTQKPHPEVLKEKEREQPGHDGPASETMADEKQDPNGTGEGGG